MIKILTVVVAIFWLSGCSTLGAGFIDAVNPMKDDKGLDVTAQVGKTNTSVDNKGLANIDSDTRTKTDNQILAERVEQNTSYKDSPWLILAFALALAAPTPSFKWLSNINPFKRDTTPTIKKDKINEAKHELNS